MRLHDRDSNWREGEQAQPHEIKRRNKREVGVMNEVALVRAAHLLIAANLTLVLARSGVGSRPAHRRSRLQRECCRQAEASDYRVQPPSRMEIP